MMADTINNPKFASFASEDGVYLDCSEVDTALKGGADAAYLFAYMVRYGKALSDMSKDNTRKYLLGAQKPWSPRRYRAALDAMTDAFLRDKFTELTLFTGVSAPVAKRKIEAAGWPKRGQDFYRAIAQQNKEEYAELQLAIGAATDPDGDFYGM